MKVWSIKTPLFVFIIMLSAGCAVHSPQSVSPPLPVPASFSEQNSLPVERWWEAFGDADLNLLMEEAFSGNPDLMQAYERFEQSRAIYRSTTAARRPSIDLQGQWSREDTPSFFGNNTGNSYILSLAAGFELDLWQKLKSRSMAAGLDMEALREEIKTLYISLSARIADLYYLAAEQRAQLKLTEQTINSYTDILSLVEGRYRQGLVPALDVYQARQNLFRVRARRAVLESSLRVTEHALSVALGHYPDNKTTGGLIELPETPAAFPSGLPSELLSRRPDVRAAFLRLKASDARVAVAVAERFPSFNLLGSYGTSSFVFSTGDIVGSFWKVLVNLSQPLLDGGRRSAEVDRSRAVFRENLAHYHKAVLKAFQEVEDALVRNRTSEERITQLQEQAEAAGSALRLSQERYMQGLSGYLPVLIAQTLYFDTQSQLLTARRQLISDRVTLARALGGEWMEHEIQERLTVNNHKGGGS
ncbi:MAG: efflux transporter outer membrane subunit [Nitrospirae bacterium]|nr:efflux transporter outer membrane subunit [Nitrospirota bacterium]